jgi:L-fucose mutarotase/ribose pyranase (RbsD/FucU family)
MLKEIHPPPHADLTSYERARAAFAVVRTGELRPCGNILLVKGVINTYTAPLW